MPLQKIVSFKGKKFFQCLHSGVLVERCYALPDRDRYLHRANGGSFADAACAVAWLEDQKKLGKISEKKYAFLVNEMRRELMPPSELIAAPDMTPEEPYWGYRADHPWVLQDDLLLSVQEVLSWREEKKETSRRKPKPYIYQAHGNGNFYALDHSQFPIRMDAVIHVQEGTVVLQDNDQQGGWNTKVEEATGLELKGDAVLILSKKFKPANEQRKKCC